ncbi:putative odorant receptor 85e [Leguminivora glycinivorella]|uniref:putative odorant receptor 85e n=1 Tax=Leguminivora glycinivorella TaxID=1035111 RepID=UPI00200F414F|nr:putative odorant receptor 85e [Leguminivora glycinivorella]
MVAKDQISDYTHFLQLPLKIVGCWDWFPNTDNEIKIILNNIYVALVLFVLLNFPITLIVNLYTEWVDIMGSLDKLADGLPLIVSLAVVIYFAIYKEELYELVEFMNENFKFHSARGLTNMTMEGSYTSAKKFAYVYTACTLFSVTMYVALPMGFHLWTHQPLQNWAYMDAERSPYVLLAFLRQSLAQAFVGLAVGQLGVFFATNSILLCGQLDLLCCSIRNARYTGLLQTGVPHKALLRQNGGAYTGIVDDERHNYIYSKSRLGDSAYNYDKKITSYFSDRRNDFDIYDAEFDAATADALRECARVCQVAATYKDKFETFISPLLALRVVQVTLYLCTLLYAASVKLEPTTVEYLAAVALDIFVYCYFGNQIILQASRVSIAAYQSTWHAMGVRSRRLLLNILLTNKRPVTVRAGRFLPMDLHTFVIIIKTSFSYYTLLDKINNH